MSTVNYLRVAVRKHVAAKRAERNGKVTEAEREA